MQARRLASKSSLSAPRPLHTWSKPVVDLFLIHYSLKNICIDFFFIHEEWMRENKNTKITEIIERIQSPGRCAEISLFTELREMENISLHIIGHRGYACKKFNTSVLESCSPVKWTEKRALLYTKYRITACK